MGSSTTASSSSSSTRTRASLRKRQSPVRYGFEAVKRRRQTNELQLLDLPEDILRSLCGYLCTPSGYWTLQTTNKLLRTLSTSPEMRKNLRLLESIRPDDSSEAVTQRLLPFCRAGNLDALLLLGRLAIYVENDLELGMALLHKGMDMGDLRGQYELANLLLRHRTSPEHMATGRRLIEDAARKGHAPSQICSQTPPDGDDRWEIYESADRELKALNSLQHLMPLQARPPRAKWAGSTCSNPDCSRQCYRVRWRRVRAWLKELPKSDHWPRHSILTGICGGTLSEHYCAQTLYYVPDFHQCARCRKADYCGRACQVVHWVNHKADCRPPIHAPVFRVLLQQQQQQQQQNP